MPRKIDLFLDRATKERREAEVMNEAYDLLQSLIFDLGPYCTGPISTATQMRLQSFIGFDDSE